MKYLLLLALASALFAGSLSTSTIAQSQIRSAREIQQALAERGYGQGKVDGLWGKRSIAALKAFQKSLGLPATGLIDDRVTRELFPAGASTPQVAAPVTPEGDRATVVQESSALPATEASSTTGETVPEPAIVAPQTHSPQRRTEVSPPSNGTLSAPEASKGSSVAISVTALGLLLAALAWRYRRRKSRASSLSREEEGHRFKAPMQVSNAETPVSAPRVQSASRPSLDAHNAAVIAFVKANNLSAHNEQPAAEPPLSASTQSRSASRLSLEAHDASVMAFVRANNPVVRDNGDSALVRKLDESGIQPAPTVAPDAAAAVALADARKLARAGRPFFGSSRRLQDNARQLPPDHAGWVPAGSSISVGGLTIAAGMFYAGNRLGKQGASYENENCLVNPKLNVSRSGDPGGTTMGYWPSYSSISAEARRSYLEWLAGTRSDPSAYIGYVFLYFYGLERRLMLEENAPDADAVCQEVRRLLDVYGSNHAFNRYAQELLSAYELKARRQDAGTVPDVEGNGFEVPTSIKMALGLRVRDGKPIEPRLLFRYAGTHPETRVRTPARRAPELLEALFVEKVNAAHPGGYRVAGGRFKTLKLTYRSCSGSFVVDVAALGGSVPDITGRAEPIGMARSIFEKCSDELDEYSRALGRSPGLKTTFAVASKLPKALRHKAADGLPGKPLDRIASLAADRRPVSVRQLSEIADLDLVTSAGKSKLRELSQLLSAFGFGNTADPGFALKQAGADDQVVLFPVREDRGGAGATEAYRSAQLSVMLGMLVGHADGSLDQKEKQSLGARIEASPNLSADERLRLKAELSLAEADPTKLNDWTRKLKDVPPSARSALAAELVAIASADGTVHAAEVKVLEGLFKKIGMDAQSLYALLHEDGASRKDDEPSFTIEAAERPAGIPIPPEPRISSSSRIDVKRLHAIRNQTSATASFLADIFAEDAEAVEPPSVIEENQPVDDELFDGLQQRYHSLVIELQGQDSWTAADFENLARSAGLMPGAARNAVNEWSMDRFDELLMEGEGPYAVNGYLLPPVRLATALLTNESAHA